jgi:hypothetical protein
MLSIMRYIQVTYLILDAGMQYDRESSESQPVSMATPTMTPLPQSPPNVRCEDFAQIDGDVIRRLSIIQPPKIGGKAKRTSLRFRRRKSLRKIDVNRNNVVELQEVDRDIPQQTTSCSSAPIGLNTSGGYNIGHLMHAFYRKI